MPQNINDALACLGRAEASDAAFRALDALQSLPPAHQVSGAAMLLWLTCSRFGVHPGDVLAQAGRRIEDSLAEALPGFEAPGSRVRAIRQYLKEEL